MHLKILLPTEILLHREILQVTAESASGEFCLKPRHIDFVTALVPGVMMYVDPDDREHFLAVDGGILIKQGDEVGVAARHAVQGELGELQDVVRNMQEEFVERERVSRSASARLEIGFYKRFLEISGR